MKSVTLKFQGKEWRLEIGLTPATEGYETFTELSAALADILSDDPHFIKNVVDLLKKEKENSNMLVFFLDVLKVYKKIVNKVSMDLIYRTIKDTKVVKINSKKDDEVYNLSNKEEFEVCYSNELIRMFLTFWEVLRYGYKDFFSLFSELIARNQE